MEKDATKSIAECPLCITKHRKGSLVRYATSHEDTVILCSNEACCYMDGGRNSPVDMISSIFSPQEDTTAQSKQDNISSYELDSLTVKPPNAKTIKTLAHDNQLADNLERDLLRKPSISDDTYIMLWPNVDALCWLDVLLCAICHNQKISRKLDTSSIISKLVVAFDEAQFHIAGLALHQTQWIYSILDKERVSIKMGGGDLLLDRFLAPQIPLENADLDKARRKLRLSSIKLECAREEIWQTMETRMKCIRGKDDSPLFAFQALAREDSYLNHLYATEYSWNMKCDSCGDVETTQHSSFIPTMPKIPNSDFTLSQPVYYIRDCFKCGQPSQKRYMSISKWPACLAIHFADGLHTCDVDILDFKVDSGGGSKEYRVSAVLSYQSQPNHFTVWQRKPTHNDRWMLYDDLQIHYLTYNLSKCCVQSQDVHIVFWECINDTYPQTESKPSGQMFSNEPTQLNKVTTKVISNTLKQTVDLTNQVANTHVLKETHVPGCKAIPEAAQLPVKPAVTQPIIEYKISQKPVKPAVKPQIEQKPTSAAVQPPPIATRQPPSATRQPPSATRQPPSATHQPPIATHQPPIATHQPPIATHQPPIATRQPPSATRQPILPVRSAQVVKPMNLADLISGAARENSCDMLDLKGKRPQFVKKLKLQTLTPLPKPRSSVLKISVSASPATPTPVLSSTNNSYASILAQINAPKTRKQANTYATPIQQLTTIQPLQPTRKSYLDLVKPLLEKTRKKTSCDQGYVPKSARAQTNPEPVTKKHVMFSNDAKPSSPANVSSQSTRSEVRSRKALESLLKKRSTSITSEGMNPAISVSKSLSNYKKNAKRSFVSDEFELPKRFKPKEVAKEETLDMPDFDEMLAAFT